MAREPAEQPRRGRAAHLLRDAAVIVVLAVAASFLVRTYLLRVFVVPSASMVDTLEVGDRILVNELVPGLIPLERGDVVVFRDPGGWLRGEASGAGGADARTGTPVSSFLEFLNGDGVGHLVKRVVGLPGDVVSCCDASGRIFVNGAAVDEPYLFDGSGQLGPRPPASLSFTVVVPDGAIWVMGDNRADSLDSRFHRGGPTDGAVPLDHVVGRAVLVGWPLHRLAWLSPYSEIWPDATREGTPGAAGSEPAR
ncbi:MAG: lepB [Naasia sp.]|jgi:signal peptidase I|uniref:signal peptidase I n=1 Tax=Naasia sp. TaxID=2546198 RepID=UPI0026020793|nr:signal peptidase I [Naasia sp.]MCU1569554.1 lepB [Naasia sp.]